MAGGGDQGGGGVNTYSYAIIMYLCARGSSSHVCSSLANQ